MVCFPGVCDFPCIKYISHVVMRVHKPGASSVQPDLLICPIKAPPLTTPDTYYSPQCSSWPCPSAWLLSLARVSSTWLTPPLRWSLDTVVRERLDTEDTLMEPCCPPIHLSIPCIRVLCDQSDLSSSLFQH